MRVVKKQEYEPVRRVTAEGIVRHVINNCRLSDSVHGNRDISPDSFYLCEFGFQRIIAHEGLAPTPSGPREASYQTAEDATLLLTNTCIFNCSQAHIPASLVARADAVTVDGAYDLEQSYPSCYFTEDPRGNLNDAYRTADVDSHGQCAPEDAFIPILSSACIKTMVSGNYSWETAPRVVGLYNRYRNLLLATDWVHDTRYDDSEMMMRRQDLVRAMLRAVEAGPSIRADMASLPVHEPQPEPDTPANGQILLGADPEFETFFCGNVVPASYLGIYGETTAIGLDGSSAQMEFRPAPSPSPEELYKNIRDLAVRAYAGFGTLAGMSGHVYALGCHVHFGADDRNCKVEVIPYRDIPILDSLIGRRTRPASGQARGRYGRLGDYRVNDHGIEYRVPPSAILALEDVAVPILRACRAVADGESYRYPRGFAKNLKMVQEAVASGRNISWDLRIIPHGPYSLYGSFHDMMMDCPEYARFMMQTFNLVADEFSVAASARGRDTGLGDVGRVSRVSFTFCEGQTSSKQIAEAMGWEYVWNTYRDNDYLYLPGSHSASTPLGDKRRLADTLLAIARMNALGE